MVKFFTRTQNKRKRDENLENKEYKKVHIYSLTHNLQKRMEERKKSEVGMGSEKQERVYTDTL